VRDLVERGGRLSAVVQRAPQARPGRLEERRRWALADPAVNASLGWPPLAQIGRLARWRQQVRPRQIVRTAHKVRSAGTSATPERAEATMRLGPIRGHGGLAHRTHDGRDGTFDEDRSHLRSGAAPLAFAAPLILGCRKEDRIPSGSCQSG
jgi:hypothetical protein